MTNINREITTVNNNVKESVVKMRKCSFVKRIVEMVTIKRTGETVQVWNDADRTEKREQFRINKVDVTMIVQDDKTGVFYVPSVTDVQTHLTSENRAFRQYGAIKEEVKINEEGLEYKDMSYVASKFLIVDLGIKVDNPQIVPAVIAKGFYWNKKWYNIAIESASQARQGEALYFQGTPAEVEEFRNEMVYGAKFSNSEGKAIIAQVETRYGLCLTSTKEIGTDWTYKIVDDPETKYSAKVKMYQGGRIVEEEKDLELSPHDGGGTITPKAALKIAYRLGKISTRDYIFFLENFKCMDSLKNSIKLQKIWAKVPSAYQIRYAGTKGLIVVYPHDEKHGIQEEMVFTKSMWKYTPDTDKYAIPLEIASWSKPSKEEAYLNYQFIQALDIKAEDLINLAKMKLDAISNEYLVNADKAKEVLGLMGKIGDDESDDPLVSKLTHVLNADEDMLSDKKVQADLKKLVEKFILRMAHGRIPVPGSFIYIFSDPGVIFGEAPVLAKGEYWFNNHTGIYAGFRSPLIYWSEPCKFNMVQKNEFWYLHDVILFNIFDDALPRAGGADC